MKIKLPSGFLDAPIAHRGLHDVNEGRPENSRAAAQASIFANYGIELDLQLSADGEAMVFHDYSLERLTEGKGPVRTKTADELSRTRLLGSNEGIPTLPRFLETVDAKVPLLIEIKDQDGALGSNVGDLEAATARALAGYNGEVAVMSFNPNSVSEIQKFELGIACGLVTEVFSAENWPVRKDRLDYLSEIPDYEKVGASFISHNVNHLSIERVAELKSAGAVVLCWTVRSASQEAEARMIADNITFEGYLA